MSATSAMTHDEIAEAYRRFGHLVLRRCRRILRDQHAAEDALQEVYVRLWKYGESFREAESKLGWLYRVSDRVCFDQLARRAGRAEAPIDEAAPPSVGPEGAAALEDADVVLRFLERFDDKVKQVAVLHYVDELSQEEIAAATGWSRPTVAKKLEFLRTRAAALHKSLTGVGGTA